MKPKNEKIIGCIKETFGNSSIHALPNIVRNDCIVIKFVWLICFFGSAVACGYFIFQSIADYLNYDIVTVIHVKKLKSIGIIYMFCLN
jgi:hypothetical protein